MRVATKLAGAFGIFIVIIAGLLVFHIHTLRQAVDTNFELSNLSSRVYTSSTRLLLRIGALAEYASKYHVTRDPGYLEVFAEALASFEESLQQLRDAELSETERGELAALDALWSVFRESAARFSAGADASPRARSDALLDEIHGQLEELRARARLLGEASREAMVERLDTSAESARQAERIAWIVISGALVLGIGVSILIIRSISDGLRRLQEGTLEVAAGNFEYRIDPRRDDEFAQLARDFNEMNEQLGELDRMKKEFLSKISHDLKTPLASITETTRALLEEVPGPLTERQERLLRLSDQSGERLSAMIAKILELSALEAGTLGFELRQTDLAALAERATQEVGLAGEEESVVIVAKVPEEPLMVVCDPTQISRVLVNLLENAVKFSPRDGVVEIEVAGYHDSPPGVPEVKWSKVTEESPEGAVLISVRDMGPGIAEEDRELIFDRFFQSESGKRIHRRGVGLGLTICREIVAAHRGALWVDAAQGGGSIFHLLLPWKGGAQQGGSPAEPRRYSSHQVSRI